jgi:hypothetical protein
VIAFTVVYLPSCYKYMTQNAQHHGDVFVGLGLC